MEEKTKGKCRFCGKEYPYASMGRHLGSCSVRQEQKRKEIGTKKAGYFELAIYPKDDRVYWLFIDICETAALKDLDQFLRDIWVECCQHVGTFKINGVAYDYMPYILKAIRFNPAIVLKDILTKGLTFRYEYGDMYTTELMIKVVDYRKSAVRKDAITLLSRNNPPEFICDACGEKPAVYVDSGKLAWEEEAFYCRDCAGDGYNDTLLPVCNSPRMGICTYDGSRIYPDQFVPDWTEDFSENTAEEAT